MKTFDKIFAAVIIVILLLFLGTNLFLYRLDANKSGRPYRVEIERLVAEIEEKGFENADIAGCEYVFNIERLQDGLSDFSDFYNTDSDYAVREINGALYRFDCVMYNSGGKNNAVIALNVILLIMSAGVTALMLFVRNKILAPFQRLNELPYELSRGNLTVPIKENKSRFFGKFVWGIDLLRENIEEQKQRELMLQKEKKTLLLSLSHDIKTPLSAIKLYAKALSKNLYSDREKQARIAENIDQNADEIERYVSKITSAAREDFLSLETNNSEFYLSELIESVSDYYGEKLALLKTDFHTAKYENCLLSGDLDRGVEVLQNIIENSVKYGDGNEIKIEVAEEDGCKLITVKNSGCGLSENELPHIFESFWRGANAEKIQGSGLGLYICRQLMHKMNGEIFAEIHEGEMCVTTVFVMAG